MLTSLCICRLQTVSRLSVEVEQTLLMQRKRRGISFSAKYRSKHDGDKPLEAEGQQQMTTNSIGESVVTSILGMKHSQAKLIVKKFPEFNTAQPQHLSDTLKYLTEMDVSLDRVLKHPWLLLIPTYALERRLKTAAQVLPSKSVQVALPFIVFKVPQLMEIGALWKFEVKHEQSLIQGNFPSRIEYLAENLKCSEMDVADFMVRVKSLPMLPFVKIEAVLQLLLGGGVHPLDIVTDPWIFIHNIRVMKERLENAVSHKLPLIKPWMLRCSQLKYEWYIERTIKESNLKPKEEDIASFLKRRLNWDTQLVNDTVQKIPSLKKCKAYRLEKMINCLVENGYSTDDIAGCPRILRHSAATVARKLSELERPSRHTCRYPIHSIRILSQSKKKYRIFNSLNTENEENENHNMS